MSFPDESILGCDIRIGLDHKYEFCLCCMNVLLGELKNSYLLMHLGWKVTKAWRISAALGRPVFRRLNSQKMLKQIVNISIWHKLWMLLINFVSRYGNFFTVYKSISHYFHVETIKITYDYFINQKITFSSNFFAYQIIIYCYLPKFVHITKNI